MTADLIKSLAVTVHSVEEPIATLYAQVNGGQRGKLLAQPDGLSRPISKRDVAAARRALTRLIAYDDAPKEWVSETVASAPPIDPLTAERLARMLEFHRQSSRLDKYVR